MSRNTITDRLKRASKRPPAYIARRLVSMATQPLRRPWSSVYPHTVTASGIASAAGAASVDALWDRLQQAPFFISQASRADTVAEYRRRFPDGAADVISAADRALRHEFDLLGSGPVDLGPSLPWHTDFKSGRQWPRQYAANIDFGDLGQPTDVKVPWELSRAQHFTWLGQAYWLTDDERYPREFVAEVTDWIAQNPWAHSVNWVCAMDVALRAVSWLWGFYFMGSSQACRSTPFRAALLKSLYLHGEYIATHLERADVNGNHYLCDGVGLVFLGTFFRDTRRGRQWLEVGREIISAEIFNQTSADGVDFEGSTAYHRLVLEAFLTSGVLLERHSDRLSPGWHARLERMIEFVDAYVKPDGSMPLLGDADDGRVQRLGLEGINDHRYLLSTGAILFDRADFKRSAGRLWEETFWLLGPASGKTFDELPSDTTAPRSAAFAEGGYYVLRSASAHAFVDCAEVGMRGLGGHGHNDILSFELWLDGHNIVTDSGAYVYTASTEWRNAFRSTAFHNVVQVDGEELNRFHVPDNLWQLRDDARPRDVRWERGEQIDRFRGAHTGYLRLSPPVDVTRELLLLREEPGLVVHDTVDGNGTRELAWRFHLAPEIHAAVDGTDVRLAAGESMYWLQVIDAANALSIELADGWMSPTYGVRVPRRVVVIRGHASLPAKLSAHIGVRRMSPSDLEDLVSTCVNC